MLATSSATKPLFCLDKKLKVNRHTWLSELVVRLVGRDETGEAYDRIRQELAARWLRLPTEYSRMGIRNRTEEVRDVQGRSP